MLGILLAQGLEDFDSATGEFKEAVTALINLGESFIFNVGFILAVLFVVIGFFRYIFNDPKAGATQVQNSLIGLAILGFSKLIIDLVGSLSEQVQSSAGGNDIGSAATQVISITLLPLILQWGSTFAVLAIVWGGLQWMTGNVTSGKAWVTNALIGLAGMLLAYVIVRTFAEALGIVNTT